MSSDNPIAYINWQNVDFFPYLDDIEEFGGRRKAVTDIEIRVIVHCIFRYSPMCTCV